MRLLFSILVSLCWFTHVAAAACVGAAENITFFVQAEPGERIEGLLKKRGKDHSLGLKPVKIVVGLPQDRMFADFVVARKNLLDGWKFEFIKTYIDGSRSWSDLQKDRGMRELQRGRRCDNIMVFSYN